MIRFVSDTTYKNTISVFPEHIYETVQVSANMLDYCKKKLNKNSLVKIVNNGSLIAYGFKQDDFRYDQIEGLLSLLKNDKYRHGFCKFLSKKYDKIIIERFNELAYYIYLTLKGDIAIEVRGDFWRELGQVDNDATTQAIDNENGLALHLVVEPCRDDFNINDNVGEYFRPLLCEAIEYGKVVLSGVIEHLNSVCHVFEYRFPFGAKYSEAAKKFSRIKEIHNKFQGYTEYENVEEREIVKQIYKVESTNELDIKEDYIIGDLDDGFVLKSFCEGQNKKNVYVIGPCIVGGYGVSTYETFTYLLQEKVEDKGYRVIKIQQGKYNFMQLDKLLEIPIRSGDIMLVVSDYDSFYEDEDGSNIVNMTDFFEKLDRNQTYFSDCALHLTAIGHAALADYIFNNIKKMLTLEDTEWVNTGHIIGKGNREQISKYVEKYKEKSINGTVGCIVMNCNPFTNGHKYLIEICSQKVDLLYVFVVEEDKSYFSFEDRFAMVKMGTANMDNVRVIPSGKFVLSASTLPSYFEKENKQSVKIDCSKDIAIFGRYIVPAFNIRYRFVGSEPYDSVTKQYNMQMKEWLGGFGVIVEEILRKRLKHKYISATDVRKALVIGDWNRIKELVPNTTYTYLKRKFLI